MAEESWSWATRAGFLVLVTFWGLNYPFVNLGLTSASPLWLALMRAGVGAAVTAVIVTARGGRGALDAAGRRDALLLGIPNSALFFGLWFWAAKSVTPGIAAVVIYTFPLWVALLSIPILSHRLRPVQWGAIASGFAGVALISQLGTSGAKAVAVPAAIALIVAAVAWAVGTVLFQRRFRRDQMMEANLFQLIGGTAGLAVATVAIAPSPLPTPTLSLVISVLWMGVLGTAVAYTIWFQLLGRTRASTLSAYVFLVPVVALAASAALFGERLDAVQLGGVVLVLLSIYGIGRESAPPAARTPEPALAP